MGVEGVGNFFSACCWVFFSGETLCAFFFFFFQTNIAFLEQWNLDSLSMISCFINYSTLATEQRIQATFQCKMFSKMYTQWERRKPLRVDGFPANFFSPYPLEFLSYSHPNDAILHSPKKPLCSALHSKISIQKEGTCLVKKKYSNDS